MPATFKVNSKPEKVIINATAAIVLSLIFDQHKKKMRGSKRYKNFPARVKKNYKLVDSLMKKTVAKSVYSEAAKYKDEKLANMTIENGEFIDI